VCNTLNTSLQPEVPAQEDKSVDRELLGQPERKLMKEGRVPRRGKEIANNGCLSILGLYLFLTSVISSLCLGQFLSCFGVTNS